MLWGNVLSGVNGLFHRRDMPPCTRTRICQEQRTFHYQGLMISKVEICCTGNEAGATYERAAQVNLKINSKHEAATCYVEASKVYQKCNKSSEPACCGMPPCMHA